MNLFIHRRKRYQYYFVYVFRYMFNLNSFHDYDIRGVYGTDFNDEDYFDLGQALGTYFKTGTVSVGHDMRLSSPSLSKNLISGLNNVGINVIFLGMISTEMNYFVSGKYDYDANIMISASHNPPKFNGVKIVKRNVVPLHGKYGFKEIKEILQKRAFQEPVSKGQVFYKNVFNEWINHILSKINYSAISGLKIVVDAGNGMGGPTWQEIMKKLDKNDFYPLYLEPDGNFPHHLADPLKDENIVDLKNAVIQKKADLGIALDGDADRIFFIDEKGEKLSGTITTAILADLSLQSHPGPILYGLICGKIVPETITARNGTPIRMPVGHSLFKEKMKETKAQFGGEHSGHFYFADNYGAESSLLAGLKMLEFLVKTKKTLSDIRSKFEKYYSSGEMNFVFSEPDSIIINLEKKYSITGKIDKLDGLTILASDYWFNVRKSNTEPLLRVNIEADTLDKLSKIKQEIISYIVSQGGILK